MTPLAPPGYAYENSAIKRRLTPRHSIAFKKSFFRESALASLYLLGY